LSEVPWLLLVGGILGLLVMSIVGCHQEHRLLGWLLHHQFGPSTWRVLLAYIIHNHGLAGLMNRHAHNRPLAIRAAGPHKMPNLNWKNKL
jgi:hypothetical protein